MKKYHQLLLLIISIISLTLLLVYRHEYNRLHYVLEVFNFFGQPCNFSDIQTVNIAQNDHDWGVQPIWQEYEHIYLYSGYWTAKSEAKVIVLHTIKEENPRSCYLWFENKKKPVIGKFKYTKMGTGERHVYSVYFYYCSLSKLEKVPYAVSFSLTNKKYKNMKKVLLTNTLKNMGNISTTVCVLPSPFVKSHLVEFLSYHKVIGLENFILYSDNIPHHITRLLKALSSRLGVTITFFPWNYPQAASNLTRTIIENDCILRNVDQSKNVLTLGITEYLVPTKHYTINEILADYNTKYKSHRLSLPVQTFCIRNNDRRKPMALQNTQISYNDENTVRYLYRESQEENIVATQAVVKGVASIHNYIECEKEPARTYSDKTIMRFSTDFTRSILMQLLFHDQF